LLLEINVLGGLAGWMEYVIENRLRGRDAVPDFARVLRHVFVAHCRRHEAPPEMAFNMAMELATALLDSALLFKRHLAPEPETPDNTVC